ncbi:hypothetical protein BLNAU_8708 [Blattamonas nauphoetae]|uniref:Uncharacterized protein n=1 Tax=Blattamonas nauphoetae TaxID=2049346 RepID=A0ABQ9XXW8_9EUKA|nr:hypothetical protein BLNAU_8708 [Blattamonas nauphoetae]
MNELGEREENRQKVEGKRPEQRLDEKFLKEKQLMKEKGETNSESATPRSVQRLPLPPVPPVASAAQTVLHRDLPAARRHFLVSFPSTLFHILSIIMLSFENLTKQQSLLSSKGHKLAGPLRKEFKSKFDLPNVFKNQTNSHEAQSATDSFAIGTDCSNKSSSEPDTATVQSAPVTPNEHSPPSHSCHSAAVHCRTKHTSSGRQHLRFRTASSAIRTTVARTTHVCANPTTGERCVGVRCAASFAAADDADTHSAAPADAPRVCADHHTLAVAPHPACLQQFTFDMSAAGKRYNNIIQSYAESTANGDNAVHLPIPDYAPLPPMSISFGVSKEQAFPESATKPLHYLSSMLIIPTPSLIAFEAMRALYFLLKCNKTAIDRTFTHLHVNSIPEIPRAFKTQLVKNSGIFYAWHVGQDETVKTEFQIRKGKLRLEADPLGTHTQLR